MAARKRKSKSTKVSVTIDAKTLQKLIDALGALSEVAAAFVQGADDPAVRRKLLKAAKKRTSSSRKRR